MNTQKPKAKVLQNTTPAKQGTGSGDTYIEARPENDAGVVWIRDEPTGEALNTVEGEEEILADDIRGDHSTVSTEASHDRRTFSSHPSTILEAETDPTSIPSGILDDLKLGRKDTESPLNSIDADYGSDSCHSAQYDSSTADGSSREGLPIGVNPSKVKAVGEHFGESSTGINPPRFHDPENIFEAHRIKDRIKDMNGNPPKPIVSQSWPDLLYS